MGNLSNTIKKFIGNKNTVTILAVIAGIIILWWFYNYRVEQAITTVKIPYAIEAVDTGKKIESDNIGTREITVSTTRNTDIVTNINELTDKYICTGTSIPKDGFFHKAQVCDKSQIKNSVFDNVPDGSSIYRLSVDNKATYGNSILPGDYIDLYVRTMDEDGKAIFAPLIESISVRTVLDSSGRDVYWDSEAGAASLLLFIVPNDFLKLFEVAEMINVKIVPIARNASYSQNAKDASIANQELYNYIMSRAAAIGS